MDSNSDYSDFNILTKKYKTYFTAYNSGNSLSNSREGILNFKGGTEKRYDLPTFFVSVVWWTQANRIRNCNIRERKTFLFCCKRQGTFSETKMTRKSEQHGRTNTRIYFQWGYGLHEKWCHVLVDRSNCFEGIWRFHFQVFFSAKTETAGSSKIFVAVYKTT